MIDLKIKWQHCWYIFQWGENGKKGKIKHAGVHRGFPGDRVCPYRMTTQLCRYLFLIWKDACGRLLHDTPYNFFYFFKEGFMNYFKISLFGGSL